MISLVRIAFLSCVLASASGCTAAGVVKGATTPTYAPVTSMSTEVTPGETIRVHVRHLAEQSSWEPDETLEGGYVGMSDGLLRFGSHEVPMRDVLSVEVRRGSMWLQGLLVGLTLDAVATTIIVLSATGNIQHFEINMH